MAQKAGQGQGAGHGQPGQVTTPPRLRRNGQPTAAYTPQVAPGGVLVVVDLDRDGQRSVTNDAAGVVSDLAEMRPDLPARVPLVFYRDSMGRQDELCASRKGSFAGSRLLAPPATPPGACSSKSASCS